MPRSSSAGTSTSCRRRWTASRATRPTVRSSAPAKSEPASGPSSIWGSRTCAATCTRRSGSSPGGTIGAAASIAVWGCASTCCSARHRRVSVAPRRDRPGVPQEDGWPHRIRPCTGVRGSGLTRDGAGLHASPARWRDIAVDPDRTGDRCAWSTRPRAGRAPRRVSTRGVPVERGVSTQLPGQQRAHRRRNASRGAQAWFSVPAAQK